MIKPVIFQLYDTETNDINFELIKSIQDLLINPMYSKVFHNYSIDAHTTITCVLRKSYPNDSAYKLQGFAGVSFLLLFEAYIRHISGAIVVSYKRS